MGELANCERCDTVFVKTTRPVCHACYQLEEDAFDTVCQFLYKRDNRQATPAEIESETGVSEALITKFVKERRLRPTDFPNLAYPCEQCGMFITTGRLCTICATSIKEELARHEKNENMNQSLSSGKSERKHAYYTLNKHK